MKETKQTQTGKNVSSGAEKVERITRETGEKKQATPRKTAEKSKSETGVNAKKTNTATANEKAAQESKAAKARVAAAIKKKEEKEKKKAERAAKRAKKREERTKRAARIAEERKVRAEKRKAELETARRERAHKKANKMQAKNKERARKQAEREEKNKSRGGKKGYGGWLAAVIALGATTLALATVVTVGAMEMKDATDNAVSGYRATTYELVGIMENVDNDLDRARISATETGQERIFTDLLVQARLAELDLEKLPVQMQDNKNLTAFINRVGGVSERLLAKLRRGERLSAEDRETLQELYEKSHAVREKMDEYAAKMCDDDFKCYMKKGEGNMATVIAEVEELTIEENRLPQTSGAGMRQSSENGKETGSPKLEPAQAEELCKRYFSAYKIEDYQCVGETVSRGRTAYNVQGYDDNGTMLFAEIDAFGGELVRFDYFAECTEEKFDVDNAKRIADAFLERLGYENMTVTRVRANGTDTDFSYVYETDGVLYYPDEVKIKVCRSRGVVTGMDAERFLRNHTRREYPETGMTLSAAQAKLNAELDVEAARLTVVQTARGERAAYEFICSYRGERYFIYTDADNGEEIAIVNVKNVG